MNQLAVNLNHVVGISQDDSLVTWGTSQEGHFNSLNQKISRDGDAHASLKLKWGSVIYKPTTLSSRGPVTAIVGAAPKIAGTGKLDEVRKTLFLIKTEFEKQKFDSYFELFNNLLINMGKDGGENKGNSLEISKKESIYQSVGLTHLEQDASVVEAEDSKVIPEKELVAKKLSELSERSDSEAKDDGFMDQMCLEKVLTGYFKLKPRECESFIYEMIKQSAHKVHSKISIRAIKDAIHNTRLDEGRIFVFMSKSNKSIKLKLHKIDESCGMSMLYCPDVYESIESVACGSSHLLILTRNGNLYSCGDSSQGVLGLGHIKKYITVPMPVVIKKHKGMRRIKMVAAGREHSMCLTTHNEIYTWGSGVQGKLGHGDEAEQNIPKEIAGMHLHLPIFLSAGDSHSACVTATGKLFTWGDGQYGKLGHGSTQTELTPLLVAALEDVEVGNVSCGSFHTLAVDRTGKAWSFGQEKSGVLGYLNAERTDTPLMIKGLEKIKFVVAGVWNSYAIDIRGKVFSWGSLEKGMLGHKATMEELHIPKPIDWVKLSKGVELKNEIIKESLVSTKVGQVICSYSNTFTVTNAGEVFVFGSNEYGQCGIDPERGGAMFRHPFKIPKFNVENNCQVKALSCGFSHVLALTTEGKLYAWGANDCGQLGNGRKNTIFEPTLVDAFKGSHVLFCACGDDYSAVINDNEELLTFGSHEKGRLGIGPVDEHGCELIPRKIDLPGFPHIKYVCCGVNHVLAIPDYDSEGAGSPKGVWSWGISSRGQLGHGNRRTLYAPQLIQKLAGEKIRKVCCGFEHSMALTDAGKVYYWGAQEHYIRSEFGDREDKLTPIIMQATSTDKIIDIASNHMYNLAIGAGKDVVYWGSFLAVSKENKDNIAIVIESKLGIKAEQISCGPNHAAALGFGESLYTWGYDTEGSLGLNLRRKQFQRAPEKVWMIKETLDKLSKNAKVALSKAEEMENMDEPIKEHEERKGGGQDDGGFVEEARREPGFSGEVRRGESRIEGRGESRIEPRFGESRVEGKDGRIETKSDARPEGGRTRGQEGRREGGREGGREDIRGVREEARGGREGSRDGGREGGRDVGKSYSKLDSKVDDRSDTRREGERAKGGELHRTRRTQRRGNKDKAHAKINDLPESANALMIHKSFTNTPSIAQERLLESQKKVTKSLGKVLEMFKEIAELAKQRKLMIKSFIINMIIRLENPPFDQKRKFHLIQKKSKVIKKNKGYLKEIFKALYLHPCYMNDMLAKKLITPEFAGGLVNSLYANNIDSKYNKVLLMNFAMLVFKYELSNNNKLQLVDKKNYTATPTLFAKIFDLIFLNDTKCIRYAAGLAAICFNDMHRIIMQLFPDEAATCFAEMSAKRVQQLNKKTIEGKLKSRCESLHTLIDKIRQQLLDGIEPDRRAGAILMCDSACRLPKIIVTLMEFCAETIKSGFNDPKENVDLKISTMLLPLIIKHTCNILSKVDLLLLYTSGERSKRELIQEEVRKQKDNSKILADIIMSYFTATKSFVEISNFRMIQDFNKELKGTEDRLIEIFRKMITRRKSNVFLKSYFEKSCQYADTIVTFTNDQIKALYAIFAKNVFNIALIRPIDKDPIYVNTQLIEAESMESLSAGQRPRNFRMKIFPLQEDHSLMICKTCNSFLTQSTSSPYCNKFVDELPRLDSLSPVFLYGRLVMKADEILISDSENSIEKMYELAKKRDHFDLLEIFDELFSVVKKMAVSAQGKQLEEIRAASVKEFNNRRKFRLLLKKKKFIINQLSRCVQKEIDDQHYCEAEVYPFISARLQYGLANTELAELTAVGRQLSLVKAAVRNIESMTISPELFEHLLLKEKKELKPFVKKSLPTLMSERVVRSVKIPNAKNILSKCSLVMSLKNSVDLEIQLVYQENKEAFCGNMRSEVEAKLFTYNFSIQDTYEVFKNAHKYNPEEDRTLTLENNHQDALVFGLDEFRKYYGDMYQQAVVYIHRTKVGTE